MPYMMVPNGGGYNVHKEGADGKASGPAKNKKPMSKAAAKDYMAALYANENKSMTDDELIAVEDKCYSDYAYVNTLSPTDPRVNYNAMGGRVGDKACANCRWFHPAMAKCDLVYGDIVSTGLSDLWLAKDLPEPANGGMTPMPVYLVDPVEAGGASLEPVQFNEAERGIIRRFVKAVSDSLGAVGKKATPDHNTESGFKVYEDGRWTAWYSNNAEDKAKEWFPAQATDSFIKRVDNAVVPYPELWHKHLPIQMGRADYLARIGYLTFATGKFYDTPAGQAGKAYYLAEQKAGRPKTMSHGFLYPKNLKQDGAYKAYNTFEISPLEPGEEANPYTLFEVKTMFASLDSKKIADLEKIFGADEAKKLINFGEVESKKLEASGVSLKAFENFGDIAVTDAKAQGQITALAEATLNGLKAIDTKLETLAADVKTAKDTAAASQAAVDGLKTFVDQQFGMTPRASQSALAAAAANPGQVAALQKANEEAGKVKPGDENPQSTNGGTKSVFDSIWEAAGVK